MANEPRSRSTAESDLVGGLNWGAALAENERWLRRVVSARLGEPQAVDEVMRNVALAAVAQRSPLYDPRRVAGWLYRMAVRQVLIHRRKSGRYRSLVVRYAERGGAVPELDHLHSPNTSESPSRGRGTR